MRKIFSLLAAVLFAGSMMAADAVIAKGTTNSYDDVTVNSAKAIKMGKSGAGGNMTITVGAGATSLSFYAAAWNNEDAQKVTITAPEGVTVTPAEITVSANANLAGNGKSFTVTPEADYAFTVTLSGATAETVLTLASEKRAFVWGATYEGGAAPEVEPEEPFVYDVWKVDSATVVAGGTKYIDNEYVTIASVYETTVQKQAQTITDNAFTHSIKVRVDTLPTATNLVGAKNAGSTPLVFTAKQKTSVAVFYIRQVQSKTLVENDSKDVLLFDQAAITTKVVADTLVVDHYNADTTYAYLVKEYILAEGHTYTLAAKGTTIQVLGLAYQKKNEEPVVPVLPDTLSCAQAREAALNGMTDNVKVRGYVTEIAYAWKDGSMSFWMADSLNGGKVFEAYKCAIEKQEDAVSVGDLVVATGKLTKYNTTPELAEGCTVEIIEKTQILPQNLGEKTIAEFLSLKNTLDTCILTGVVDSIMNTTYGNLYLSDATAQLYIYGLLNAAGEAKKFAELGVAAGDTLTVLAVYNEHQGAPQAKNAVFVEVKKAPAETIEVKMTEGLTFMDNVASEGWWEMYGENDKFIIDLSNKETTQLEGTYTYEDLDPNYAFIVVINGTDSTEVNFVDGAVTLSKDAEQGTITIKGALTGEDGNVYNIELVFSEPKSTETVTVNIQNAQMETTYANYGLYGIYGYDENNVFVMLSVWAEEDLEGQYTEQDLDFAYLGSGIIDGEDMVNIYKAAITITPGNGDDYLLTATLLCYNNKQYNVTMYIPAGQGIEDVEATVKAFKRIVNGQVIIEKNGVQYNVLGNTVK